MKKHWLRLKQFFRVPTLSSEWEPTDGLTQTSIVDLNAQERDFINWQTRRLMLTQKNTQISISNEPTWKRILPKSKKTPSHSSSYAYYKSK